jgi:hypothetical protein
MSESKLPKHFRQLLSQTLPAAFRGEVVETLLTDKEARSAAQEAMGTVAALRKMRPQTIGMLGRPQRANLFLTSLAQPAMETAAMQALQVWFLRKGRSLMSEMLDAWKISHENGELNDDVELPSLSAEQVRAAAQAAVESHSKAAVVAYVAYNHLAPSAEGWQESFGEVLEEMLAAD